VLIQGFLGQLQKQRTYQEKNHTKREHQRKDRKEGNKEHDKEKEIIIMMTG
jgi:hypothetical protein